MLETDTAENQKNTLREQKKRQFYYASAGKSDRIGLKTLYMRREEEKIA